MLLETSTKGPGGTLLKHSVSTGQGSTNGDPASHQQELVRPTEEGMGVGDPSPAQFSGLVLLGKGSTLGGINRDRPANP